MQLDENDSNIGGNDVLLYFGNFLSSHMKIRKLLRMVTSFRTNIKLEFLPSLQGPLDKADTRCFRERKNILSLAVETHHQPASSVVITLALAYCSFTIINTNAANVREGSNWGCDTSLFSLQ